MYSFFEKYMYLPQRSLAMYALLLLYVMPIASADEQRSLFLENEPWADIKFSARGSAIRTKSICSIKIDTATVTVSNKVSTPLHIIGAKVGMAYQQSKTEWDIYKLSPLQKMNVIIKPGEEQELLGLHDFETSISHKDAESDTERWVIIEFAVKDKQHGKIFFYAHEPQE